MVALSCNRPNADVMISSLDFALTAEEWHHCGRQTGSRGGLETGKGEVASIHIIIRNFDLHTII